jgi:hypothetical protein
VSGPPATGSSPVSGPPAASAGGDAQAGGQS